MIKIHNLVGFSKLAYLFAVILFNPKINYLNILRYQ